MIKEVVPNREFIPERVYVREASLISCYEIKDFKEVDMEVKKYGKLLFILELPDIELADKVMKDLYYGEYTGS